MSGSFEKILKLTMLINIKNIAW
jgi:hypothetical protein